MKLKWLWVLLSYLLYLILYYFTSPIIGPGAASIASAVPVIVAGIFYELAGGIAASFFLIATNILMYQLVAPENFSVWLPKASMTGFTMIFIIGVSIGYMGRLSRKLREQVAHSKALETAQSSLIDSLQEALANVRELKGLLPICSSCKQIRDDKGYWHLVENYIQKRSNADFAHTLCPDCKDKSAEK